MGTQWRFFNYYHPILLEFSVPGKKGMNSFSLISRDVDILIFVVNVLHIRNLIVIYFLGKYSIGNKYLYNILFIRIIWSAEVEWNCIVRESNFHNSLLWSKVHKKPFTPTDTCLPYIWLPSSIFIDTGWFTLELNVRILPS